MSTCPASRFVCHTCRRRIRNLLASPPTYSRSLSNQAASGSSDPTASSAHDPARLPPRWARTPAFMQAPHRTRPKTDNDAASFPVNQDPKRLDNALLRMLGPGADKLPEGVKWLSVTHKSFDHGRRGFNDRLAHLGRRILELQTSLALIDAPRPSLDTPNKLLQELPSFLQERNPVDEPALRNIEVLAAQNARIGPPSKNQVLDRSRLAQLAEGHGLSDVIRWKPRQLDNLKSSGIDTVLAHTIYALVGAVALCRGGEQATKVARKRVLARLGVIAQ